ncbi:hypothetical protein SEA_LEWANDO_1 [Arthrobacter phage Lewando]|nr:hypothetical protein SEA_LEWANDO_1 [Arthrobacter phage Lewando]
MEFRCPLSGILQTLSSFVFVFNIAITFIFIIGGNMKKVLAVLGMSAALALGATAISATPAAPVTQKAEAAVAIYGCQWRFDGTYWCYRTGCSLTDRILYYCYNGWFKVNRPWQA